MPLPTSSSSDKYDANEDDVVSIERQQETAFVVVAQTRIKMPKGLQSNSGDEEMR